MRNLLYLFKTVPRKTGEARKTGGDPLTSIPFRPALQKQSKERAGRNSWSLVGTAKQD